MSAVLTQPRQTKTIPRREESQVAFVARANRELYRKIPDALKRNRHILRCWREAGRDSAMIRAAAERFPETEYQTIHDLPIFPEHSTVGSDGKKRIYDRNALQIIVDACNHRILDTGDFAALTAGHTPDDPTSAHVRIPEVLGYEGPYRLGMVGNLKPKWCIFADEHQRRDKIDELKHLPRRSAEVWLEDNILDPIAALGAETPRLDTGIVRNCRLPSGREITKYSAVAAYPGGMNTSAPTFPKKSGREVYAAGDPPMNPTDGMSAAEAPTINSADVKAIVAELLQSKPMMWVQSQMPPDWTPDAQEPDEVAPGDGTDVDGAAPAGEVNDAEFNPELAAPPEEPEIAQETEMLGGDELPPTDIGAETAAEYPEDAATPDEEAEFDDEEREHYAAHDSAGRKGFLWAWRRGRKQKTKYSAGTKEPCMPAAPKGERESYSRLAAENAAQAKRIDELEARSRHAERYSKLHELHQTRVFDLDAEMAEVKDIPQEQFDKHLTRIRERYSRLPVARGGFTQKLPVEQPEVIVSDKEAAAKTEKYSRRAYELANAEIKKGGFISWDEAMQKAIAEDTAAAK